MHGPKEITEPEATDSAGPTGPTGPSAGTAETSEGAQSFAQLRAQLARSEARREAAEAAERRYRLFLDNVQDYAFITFDLDNRVIGWSRGAERILGYPEAEALGMHGSCFFVPEDLAKGEDVREVETARAVGRAEDERWHLRRDGTRFYASGILTALRDDGGTTLGFSKVLRDLTARKLSEAQVRESEERFRLFTENVGDYALVPVDLEGRVVGWNTGAERIFGYREHEILGRSNAVFFNPEDRAIGQPERDLQHALTQGRTEDARWMVRWDGSRFWSRWITTPMRDERGQLRGFAKVIRDETDKKHAEEEREELLAREHELLRVQVRSTGEALDRTRQELRALTTSLLTAQEEERRRIARELHDDIGQRLAALEMGLARLREHPPTPGTQHADELRKLGVQVTGLADEVRRLSHQLHPSILEDLGLGAALRRLTQDFAASRSQPLRFETRDVPDEIPAPVATAFYRIAQEALRNVARHAGAAPVSVMLVGGHGQLRMTISDSGPGFVQAAKDIPLGLGLISMRERARLVGSHLDIHSQPGVGTTVTVRASLDHEPEASS